MQNSPSPEELHAFDREHFLHPWHDMNAWRGYDNMLVEAAQGIYLYDETGKKFIDGPGGMWCVQIGYGQAEMAQAISEQVLKMPYASPFTNVTQPGAILAKKLADFAPGDLNNVFFHHRRLHRRRYRFAGHAVYEQQPRTARKEDDPRAGKRLSRLNLFGSIRKRQRAGCDQIRYGNAVWCTFCPM